MLRTTDGKTMDMIMKDLEEFSFDETHKHMWFELDGSTSDYINHDGQNILVDANDIRIRLIGGKNLIDLPNYNHVTLESMIKRAAEILWFEWDMEV